MKLVSFPRLSFFSSGRGSSSLPPLLGAPILYQRSGSTTNQPSKHPTTTSGEGKKKAFWIDTYPILTGSLHTSKNPTATLWYHLLRTTGTLTFTLTILHACGPKNFVVGSVGKKCQLTQNGYHFFKGLYADIFTLFG